MSQMVRQEIPPAHSIEGGFGKLFFAREEHWCFLKGTTMRWMTRQSQANSALQRYMVQYPHPAREIEGVRVGDRTERLKALGDQPDPDLVDAIMGNRSWTAVPHCGECGGRSLPAVLEIGEMPDYDSRTAYVCEACLTEGLSTVPRLPAAPVGGEAVIRTLASRLTPEVLRQVLVDLDDGSADDDGSARLLMARLSQQLETLTGER